MALPAQLPPDNPGLPLCASQDLLVDNGRDTGSGAGTGGFTLSCLNCHQKKQQLQPLQLQHVDQGLRLLYDERKRNQGMPIRRNPVFSNSMANNLYSSNSRDQPSSSIAACEGSLALRLEKQLQYTRSQNENLIFMVQGLRSSLDLLSQKDETVTQAQNRILELEAENQEWRRVAQEVLSLDNTVSLSQKDEIITQAEKRISELEAENQEWRRVAQENQAMVLSLNNTVLLSEKDEIITQAEKRILELEAENQEWRRVAQENQAMVLSLNNTVLLSQKDEIITQAEKRILELEAENREWRRVAQENQAIVLSLNKTVELMKEGACYCFNNVPAADDIESFSVESRRNREMEKAAEETADNIVGSGGFVGDDEEIKRKMMVCKGCNSLSSCFLFLPCGHLCSCQACEPILQACPVCGTPKTAGIKALIM